MAGIKLEAKLIGAKVKEARKDRGLKQVDLAEMAGLSNTTLCDIEKGRMIPSLESLLKLALALGRSIEFFLPNCYENNVNILKPTGTEGGE